MAWILCILLVFLNVVGEAEGSAGPVVTVLRVEVYSAEICSELGRNGVVCSSRQNLLQMSSIFYQ